MSRTDPGPPRVAERLLSATLEPRWAETILGDLHEEHARRATASRFAASVWYSLQALRLASRYGARAVWRGIHRSEEHTSELQSQSNLVCRLLLEKKKKKKKNK